MSYPNSSFRSDNKYRFHCPVVGRDEFLLACWIRRYRHWRGEDVAQGECRMCMRAFKCPALHMIAQEDREKRVIFFDAAGGKVNRLPAAIQEQVDRIVVRPHHALGLEVSDEWIRKLTGGERLVVATPGPEQEKSKRRGRAPVKAETVAAAPVGAGSMVDLGKVDVDLAGGINAA